MQKVTIALPHWIGQDEAQDMVVRDLRAHALLKLGFYRSKMKPFEAKYVTTLPRFQRRVEKGAREDFVAWDDLIEWEAYYRGYQEWKMRYTAPHSPYKKSKSLISRGGLSFGSTVL